MEVQITAAETDSERSSRTRLLATQGSASDRPARRLNFGGEYVFDGTAGQKELAANILEGDALAFDEWKALHRRRSDDSPERVLMFNLLADAIGLIAGQPIRGINAYAKRDELAKEMRAEARAWLMGQGYDARAITSSDSVCAFLGIDIEALRDALRAGGGKDFRRNHTSESGIRAASATSAA